MNTISAIAASGMQAATSRLESSAKRIASASVPDTHKPVIPQSQETAGAVTAVGKADEIGPDLAAELVEQMSASYSFKANLKTIQTQDQLLGSLLDVKA